MSISFYFLLLFLICISFLHPSHSQCLQLDGNKFQKRLQAPIKGKMGKMVISREEAAIECMKLSSPKPAEEEESFGSKRQKYKRIRREQLKRLIRDQLEKVPWKVPHDDDDHKKVKGNDGVFSSDYEHARTHPPSHN